MKITSFNECYKFNTSRLCSLSQRVINSKSFTKIEFITSFFYVRLLAICFSLEIQQGLWGETLYP